MGKEIVNILLIITFVAPFCSTEEKVELIYPHNWEVLNPDSTVTIEWDLNIEPIYQKIFYCFDTSNRWTLIDSVEGLEHSTEWLVPSVSSPELCGIKVTAYISSLNTISDSNYVLIISPPVLTSEIIKSGLDSSSLNVELKWKFSPGSWVVPLKYNLYRKIDKKSNWTVIYSDTILSKEDTSRTYEDTLSLNLSQEVFYLLKVPLLLYNGQDTLISNEEHLKQ